MASPYHHAESSARKFGGSWHDYYTLHAWFDETKAHVPDFRHRALRHHSEGIALAIKIHGPVIVRDDGGVTPTAFVAEQHVHEDCGFIPTAYQWLEHLHTAPWMLRGARRLSEELDLSEETRHDESDEPDDGPGAVG